MAHQVTCFDDGTPNMKSISCGVTALSGSDSGSIFKKCLIVTVDQLTMLAGLNGSDLDLEGSLYNEHGELLKNSHVTVAKDGNEKEAQVMMQLGEEDSQILLELDCNLTTGACKRLSTSTEVSLEDDIEDVPGDISRLGKEEENVPADRTYPNPILTTRSGRRIRIIPNCYYRLSYYDRYTYYHCNFCNFYESVDSKRTLSPKCLQACWDC